MPKERDLTVLTRAQGVRKENPLMTVGKYYPRYMRTPALRKEADELTRQPKPMKGMVVRQQRVK